MKYTIKIEYTTGDSFHTEEAEGTVGLVWENMDVAKQALQRIKEHYNWFRDQEGYYRFNDKPVPRPKWHKTNMEDDKFSRMHVINLPLDDGEEHQIECFWCGYFETPHNATIVVAQEEIDEISIFF